MQSSSRQGPSGVTVQTSGTAGDLPPAPPGDGAKPPTLASLPPAPPGGESPPPSGGDNGRRVLWALAAVAGSVILVAAGFGLAQLVQRDSVDSASRVTAAEGATEDGADVEPDASPVPEPAPPSATDELPFLDEIPFDDLPFDRDQVEEFLEGLQDRFSDGFDFRFDGEFPSPENIPELDELPELPGLDELPLLDELPFDPEQLQRLFEQFQDRFGDDFRGQLREGDDLPRLDQLPFFDELPFDEEGLGELFERFQEQFGDSLPPGLDLPDSGGDPQEAGVDS